MPLTRRPHTAVTASAAVSCALLLVAALTAGAADASRLPWDGGATTRTERHLVVDGLDRRYLLDVPRGRSPKPRPVILALHGGLGSPEQFSQQNGLVPRAAPAGYVVVHPAGVDRTWNADYWS